jgi:hypothetical protein
MRHFINIGFDTEDNLSPGQIETIKTIVSDLKQSIKRLNDGTYKNDIKHTNMFTSYAREQKKPKNSKGKSND